MSAKSISSKAISVLVAIMAAFAVSLLWASPQAYAATEMYTNLIPTGGEDNGALANKQVTFNGHKWHIIEDNSTGAQEGYVTLLAADKGFGWIVWGDAGANDYDRSSVKAYLTDMVNTGEFKNVASALRDTPYGKMYLLSTDEATQLPENVRRINFKQMIPLNASHWWLRSPGTDSGKVAYVNGDYGMVLPAGHQPNSDYGLRPALQLNLKSVVFDSSTKTFLIKQYPNIFPTNNDNAEQLIEKQVNFNGRKWYVIADDLTSPTEGTVTLLSADTSFGVSKFSDSSNDYASSTVKAYLDDLLTQDEGFKDVAGVMKDTPNGKLYLLSYDEASNAPTSVMKADFSDGDCSNGEWWLRTGKSNDQAMYAWGTIDGHVSEGQVGVGSVTNSYGIRPAVQLDMSAVMYVADTKTFAPNMYTSLIPADDDGIDVNEQMVYFNGHKWVIIKDESMDPEKKSVTLFAADDSFGSRRFAGEKTSYENSEVKAYLDDLVATGEFKSVAFAMKDTPNGKLYLLGYDDYMVPGSNPSKFALANEVGRLGFKEWWTRWSDGNKVYINDSSTGWYMQAITNFAYVCGVRPALQLDLTAVNFDPATKTFTAHEHELVYSANGNTITATCKNIDHKCKLVDYTTTLTIDAPTLTTYGQTGEGISADAVITDEGNIQGNAEVEYFEVLALEDGEIAQVSDKLPAAPTDAGTYLAVITLGTEANSASATVMYTIGKADNPATVGGEVRVTKGGKTIDLAGNVAKNAASGDVTYAFDGDAIGCTLDGSVLTSGDTAGTVKVAVTVAEDDNYKALEPAIITVNVSEKDKQTIEAEDVEATYGDSDKAVSGRVTDPAQGTGEISYAVKAGSEDYIDVDASTGVLSIKKVPADGKAYVVVTAAETETSEVATQDVTVTISKAATAPAMVRANGWTADGAERPLVTVDGTELVDGTMVYALGSNASNKPANSAYAEDVPTATDAGTYYVWYKVAGDENHNDTTPVCVTVTVAQAAGAGEDQSDQVYTISSAEEWDAFAAKVNSGTSFAGKVVRLAADISVSTMAGTNGNRFKGTFDGDGRTLTFNYMGGDSYVAPFRYVDGARFINLTVAGTIQTSNQFAGGIVADARGNTSFVSCRSKVAIESSRNGDGTHGGLVARADTEGSHTAFTDCLFDGSIAGETTTHSGGLLGWPGVRTGSFENCLNAGEFGTKQEEGVFTGCGTFSRVYDANNITIENCYYKTAYGEVQGTQTDETGETLRAMLGDGWAVDEDGKAGVVPGKSDAASLGIADYETVKFAGMEWLVLDADRTNGYATAEALEAGGQTAPGMLLLAKDGQGSTTFDGSDEWCADFYTNRINDSAKTAVLGVAAAGGLDGTGEGAADKAFLLSTAEYAKYNWSDTSSRMIPKISNPGQWWLRSGTDYVGANGETQNASETTASYGARPAINLKLDHIIVLTDASPKTIKSFEEAVADAKADLQAVIDHAQAARDYVAKGYTIETKQAVTDAVTAGSACIAEDHQPSTVAETKEVLAQIAAKKAAVQKAEAGLTVASYDVPGTGYTIRVGDAIRATGIDLSASAAAGKAYGGNPMFRVLKVEDGKMLLMSEYLWAGGKGSNAFGRVVFGSGNAWQGSTAQTWAAAFGEDVLGQIKGLAVNNVPGNVSDKAYAVPEGQASGGAFTTAESENILTEQDTVFFLSDEESLEFMKQKGDRVARLYGEGGADDASYWWLRSAVQDGTEVGYMAADGSAAKRSPAHGSYARPAFWADMADVDPAIISRSIENVEGTTRVVYTLSCHEHKWTYTAEGDTITISCVGGCTHGYDKTPATLTIAAPTLQTYGQEGEGISAEASITDKDGFQGEAKVAYYKTDESGEKTGEALEGAPTDAGTYWAEITLGEDDAAATAHVAYEIAKADPVAAAPEGLKATYGQTLADVALENPEGNTKGTWTWVDEATTSVGNVGENTFKVNFAPEDEANYKSVSEVDVKVNVAKAKAPEVVIPALEAIAYDPDKTLADVELSEGWAWAAPETVPAVGDEGYTAVLAVDDANYDYTDVEGYDEQVHAVIRTIPLAVDKAIVDAPVIPGKPFTGKKQTADVAESDFYTVTANVGGTEIGSYDVVLELKDPAHYKWADSDEAAKTLAFEIYEAEHDWGAATYTWSKDNKKVTATRVCVTCGEKETETVNTTSKVSKQPTASAKGETTYTATFKNKAFAKQTKTVADIAKLVALKSASAKNQTYTGKALKPAVTVKDANGKTVAASNYTVAYTNNTKVGTATATVTAKADSGYTGTVKATFQIKSWKRLWGNTALDTMQKITTEYGKASVAIVATNADFKDSLAAAALAGGYNAPMLTTGKGSLSEQTKSELKRMGVKTVYLIGSTAEVSANTEKQIKALGITVKRVNASASKTSSKSATSAAPALTTSAATSTPSVVSTQASAPAATPVTLRAIECAKLVKGRSDTVIIATQNSFKDALAIAPYAYATKSPILYAESNKKLSTATVNYIKSAKFKKAIIVGGPVALPKDIETQLKSAGIAAGSITRLAGADAYKTARVIAEWATGSLKNGTGGGSGLYQYASIKFQPAIKMTANKIGVARSNDNKSGWKDALAGAALCGKNTSVLILADANNSAQAEAFVKSNKASISYGYVFGGTSAVPKAVMDSLVKASL